MTRSPPSTFQPNETSLIPAGEVEFKPVGASSRAVSTESDAPPPVGPTRVPQSIHLVSIVALATTAVWAAWPLSPPAHSELIAAEQEAAALQPRSSTVPAPLVLDAFRVPIWVTPPSPEPPLATVATPALPPLRLQLLAITRVGVGTDGTNSAARASSTPSELRATLYDPDTDRLWIVASGEKIGERTVERVNSNEIEIVGPDGHHVLTLADAGGAR